MLIQKSPAIGEIVSIKLVNGDEIVGKLVAQERNSYTIGKPRIIVSATGFLPFMHSNGDDGHVTLPIAALLMIPLPTHPEIADHYRRAIGA